MKRQKLTGTGQVTIPQEVMDYLKLQPGDEVYFYINNLGRVVMRPRPRNIGEMAGILKDQVPRRKKPVTIEEMNEAILREHSKERVKKR